MSPLWWKGSGSIFRNPDGRLAALWARHRVRAAELSRYYKIGIVNTVFGYGLYSLIVFVGVNLFLAQIVSHVTGAIFNYYTFSRHVFHGTKANVFSYAGSYGVNYLLGLAALAIAHSFVKSPYLSGFMALVAVSVVNYFMLKIFVFRTRRG